MVLEDVSSQDEEPPSSLLPHEIVVAMIILVGAEMIGVLEEMV